MGTKKNFPILFCQSQ